MTIFRCPNCGRPLAREPHRLACPAGHSFDLAKSGYVNLLLSRQARPPKRICRCQLFPSPGGRRQH